MILEEQIAEAMIRATTAPAEAGDDAVKHAREEDGTLWHMARVQARAAIAVQNAEIESLRAHIKLHAGDCLSLDNEVTLMRDHWLAAEARIKELEAQIPAPAPE